MKHIPWARAVAQLVEELLLVQDVICSNPIIGKNLFTIMRIENTKTKKKRPRRANFLT